MNTTELKKVVPVRGSRRLSNLVTAGIVFLGSVGFLGAGLFSYLGWISSIVFFPQGLVMTFYGFVGLALSLYLGLTIYWAVGEGFNEFDLENQEIKQTDPANGINEYKDSHELMAHVIILRKLF